MAPPVAPSSSLSLPRDFLLHPSLPTSSARSPAIHLYPFFQASTHAPDSPKPCCPLDSSRTFSEKAPRPLPRAVPCAQIAPPFFLSCPSPPQPGSAHLFERGFYQVGWKHVPGKGREAETENFSARRGSLWGWGHENTLLVAGHGIFHDPHSGAPSACHWSLLILRVS